MRGGKTGIGSRAAAGAAVVRVTGSSASRAGIAGQMRGPPPSSPTISRGYEGPARSLRKRGRRPEPGEAGACDPDAPGPEESRRKRRMVGRASEREEADSDTSSGEASGPGKAEARWPAAGGWGAGRPLTPVGPAGLRSREGGAVPWPSGRHSKEAPRATPSLAFVPQPAPSSFHRSRFT